MARFFRTHKRQDFTELLNELNGVGPVDKDLKQTNYSIEKKDVVDLAKRRRASLMDNSDMLYVYSGVHRVLHDRDCFRLPEIPDEEFEMLSEFDVSMKTCPMCYRRALIRSGVGADRRRIHAYERFFKRVEVSNEDLYLLLIENKAQLRWRSNDVMEIRVRDDSWQIRHNGDALELWHNNYACLDDLTRHFTVGFHRQEVYGFPTIRNLFNLIVTYSWEKHLESVGECPVGHSQ